MKGEAYLHTCLSLHNKEQVFIDLAIYYICLQAHCLFHAAVPYTWLPHLTSAFQLLKYCLLQDAMQRMNVVSDAEILTCKLFLHCAASCCSGEWLRAVVSDCMLLSCRTQCSP